MHQDARISIFYVETLLSFSMLNYRETQTKQLYSRPPLLDCPSALSPLSETTPFVDRFFTCIPGATDLNQEAQVPFRHTTYSPHHPLLKEKSRR